MALFLRIKSVDHFNIPRGGASYVQAKFRSANHLSRQMRYDKDGSKSVTVNEEFQFPVARKISQDEIVEISIVQDRKYRSRRVLGLFRMVMQRVVEDNFLFLRHQPLEDLNRGLLKITVSVEISYMAPDSNMQEWRWKQKQIREAHDDDELDFDLMGTVAEDDDDRDGRMTSASNFFDDFDDDDDDGDYGGRQSRPTSRASVVGRPKSVAERVRNKLKAVTRSKSATKSVAPEDDDDWDSEERVAGLPDADDDVALMFSSKQQNRDLVERDFSKFVTSTLVKGSAKPLTSYFPASKGALAGDNMLGISGGDGGGFGGDDGDEEEGFDDEKEKMFIAAASAALGENDLTYTEGPPLRRRTYQVQVNVIECKHLNGTGINPICFIQLGPIKKKTMKIKGTNEPAFNQEFFFDLFMPFGSMLDKVVTIGVVHKPRNPFRRVQMIGTAKIGLDVIYGAKGFAYAGKWVMLHNPKDLNSGSTGFVKIDISLQGGGLESDDPKPEESRDSSIEKNIFMPEIYGGTTEQDMAKYIIKIHKADGLPQMNSSVSKVFGKKDLVDPYVKITFNGTTERTTTRKATYRPIWDEQIVFTDLFPPLSQRIKFQLFDEDTLSSDVCIGTHYINLDSIMNRQFNGWTPTFGPAYINFYGSSRTYKGSVDDDVYLNHGFGEGISFRGRLLVQIRVEVADKMDHEGYMVERKACKKAKNVGRLEEYLLYGCIFDVNMIPKIYSEKAVQFEVSLGTAGNNYDGYMPSFNIGGAGGSDVEEDEDDAASQHGSVFTEDGDDDEVMEREAKAEWESVTNRYTPESNNDRNFYLEVGRTKPAVYIKSYWEEQSSRMFVENIVRTLFAKFEKEMKEMRQLLRRTKESRMVNNEEKLQECKAKLEAILNDVGMNCSRAGKMLSIHKKKSSGKTQLDSLRRDYIKKELEFVANVFRSMKVTITAELEHLEFKTQVLMGYLQRFRLLLQEPQHALPDVFIWMIAGGERAAYVRIPAKDLMYSHNPLERGRRCGRLETYFLKIPGFEGIGAANLTIQSALRIYLWLGTKRQKAYFLELLPDGYEITDHLLQCTDPNIKDVNYNPPRGITYTKEGTQNFQFLAHIYQARNLLPSDASGLSDPFCVVCLNKETHQTITIEQDLNPVYKQTLMSDCFTICGPAQSVKDNPPVIVTELFDEETLGDGELLGRVVCFPKVKTLEEAYSEPKLTWFGINRGEHHCGDLLAVFELFQLAPDGATDEVREFEFPYPQNVAETIFDHDHCTPDESKKRAQYKKKFKRNFLPMPESICPKMSWHRIEVMFWGLRDLKTGFLTTIKRPFVTIECSGQIQEIRSDPIMDVKNNPSFDFKSKAFIQNIDIMLPDNAEYCPPLSIKVFEQKTFGRPSIFGTHIVTSIGDFEVNLDAELTEAEIQAAQHKWSKAKNPDESDDEIASLDEDDDEAFNVPEEEMKKEEVEAKLPEIQEDELDWWSKYYYSKYNEIKENEEEALENLELEENEDLVEELEEKHDEDIPEEDNLSLSRVGSIRYSKRSKKSANNPINDNVKNKALEAFAKSKGKINLNAFSGEEEEDDDEEAVKLRLSRIELFEKPLEEIYKYNNFNDVLQAFQLKKGKVNLDDEDEVDDASNICGSFKGNLKMYKIPKWLLSDGEEVWKLNRHKMGPLVLSPGRGLPINEVSKVKVLVYILKANKLHPADADGKADPFTILKIGKTEDASMEENYVPKTLNPVFGKCYIFEPMFPHESTLSVSVFDADLVSKSLMGETKIDLEKRFYSRSLASCALADKYEKYGHNKWRDVNPPTKILENLCKQVKLGEPKYSFSETLKYVEVAKYPRITWDDLEEKYKKVKIEQDDSEEEKPDDDIVKECLALEVLLNWNDPRLGQKNLVKEYVEKRPLYLPDKPGITQGSIEMWVDIFPVNGPTPVPVDVTPRAPKNFELRIIIWNTEDVELTDYNFLTKQYSADIFVKGWVLDDFPQKTDVHYMSMTGEGNFNWRYLLRFDYMEAEEKVVQKKKASFFDKDETEFKYDPQLTLQVWDLGLFGNSFIGSNRMDLRKVPKPDQGSKQVRIKPEEKMKYIDLFKTRAAKGWWPVTVEEDDPENPGQKVKRITGKIEAEMSLVDGIEADDKPVGRARKEPEPLDKPNRPDLAFMWLLMPLRIFYYVFIVRFKKPLIILTIILILAAIIVLFVYTSPGAITNAIFGSIG